MKFWRKLSKKFNKKKLVFGVLIGVFVFGILGGVFAPQITVAAGSWGDNVKEVGYIGGTILTLASSIMTLAAGLTDFAVYFGNSVLKLEAVQKGWGIVLQLTNLGFVLAIIVIAFATIFRLESYALKQTLWKLIVAALLVNFSLVIAGGFLSVSKIAGDIFYNAAVGEEGSNLSNALANAMKPQKFSQVKDVAEMGAVSQFFAFLEDKASVLSPTAWLKYFASIFFLIVFTFLIVLAYLTLFIMLLVRALALIFLLILSPLIWLCWILPATQKYWTQWWQEFIRWNFFVPVVYFFIYLSIMTAAALDRDGSIEKGTIIVSKGAESAASVFDQQSIISDMFTHAANLFVILGMLYGGIYLANKFGIAGGSIGVNLAQKAGKGVGGWVGKRGIQMGTRPLRGEWGRKTGEWMQKIGSDPNTLLGRSKIGRTLANVTVNKLGNAVSNMGVRQGETLVKNAEGAQKKYSDKELATRVHQMNNFERIAALDRLSRAGNLNMVPNVAQYIDYKEQSTWDKYGKKKAYNDIEKTVGFNVAMRTGLDKDGKKVDLKTATQEFIRKYSSKDYDKLQGNILSRYDTKDNNLGLNNELHNEIRDEFQITTFEIHPGAINKERSKLKGKDVVYYQNNLEEFIEAWEKSNNIDSDKDVKNKLKDIEHAIKNNAISSATKDGLNTMAWISSIYNTQRNFAGSLLGSGFIESGAVAGTTTSPSPIP